MKGKASIKPKIAVMPPINKDLEKDLDERIKAIPENKKTIQQVFKVISDWEISAIQKMRDFEYKAKSYHIGV